MLGNWYIKASHTCKVVLLFSDPIIDLIVKKHHRFNHLDINENVPSFKGLTKNNPKRIML